MLYVIDHLLDWTKALPIFVITLSRPELIDRRPEWGAGRRNFVSLALEPLPDAAMAQLLDGLVPGLPRPVVRQIVGRAEGMPLYAVETVRMLVAEGRLQQTTDGTYAQLGQLDAIAIPESLTALIAARLDSIDGSLADRERPAFISRKTALDLSLIPKACGNCWPIRNDRCWPIRNGSLAYQERIIHVSH